MKAGASTEGVDRGKIPTCPGVFLDTGANNGSGATLASATIEIVADCAGDTNVVLDDVIVVALNFGACSGPSARVLSTDHRVPRVPEGH